MLLGNINLNVLVLKEITISCGWSAKLLLIFILIFVSTLAAAASVGYPAFFRVPPKIC
jgi:hypothetical protein